MGMLNAVVMKNASFEFSKALFQPVRIATVWIVGVAFIRDACAGPIQPPQYGASAYSTAASANVDEKKLLANLRKTTAEIERLRRRMEEWGMVTVSSPLVMKQVGEFDLGDPATFPRTIDYINLALTSAQGGASQSTSTDFSNQLSLTVTPNFSINPASGERQANSVSNSLTPPDLSTASSPLAPVTATANLNGGTSGGTAPFAPAGSLIVPPNGTAQILKAPNAAPSPLNSSSGFVLSGSQAALIGENAKITELLGRTMAHPQERLFTNPEFEIHFAIVEVSCNPGWRTQENYIADVSATCEYYQTNDAKPDDPAIADPKDGGIPLSPPRDEDYGKVVGYYSDRKPVVFSVLPLLDAQTLELQNSNRQLIQLAADVAAAYPSAAANLKGRDLIQFVKQFQSDVQTVTPKTVANSYSSGSTFGFRLMPSLTALKDPARKGSPAANILQATSFPVLVTIVANRKDLAKLGANSVRVNISNRWLLNDRPPAKEIWRRIGLPMWREYTEDRVKFAKDVGHAKVDIFDLKRVVRTMTNGGKYDDAVATLDRDFIELQHKIIGSTRSIFCFPPPTSKRRDENQNPGNVVKNAPVIRFVLPNTIIKKGNVTLFINGLNFFGLKPGVTAPPLNASVANSLLDEIPVLADDRGIPSKKNTPAKRLAKNAGAVQAGAVIPPNVSPNNGINVFLGQIPGDILFCNGDDQMVVTFKNVESLADGTDTANGVSSYAPLIVQTNWGAAAWGQAVKLQAPPTTPTPTAKTTAVDLTALSSALSDLQSSVAKDASPKANNAQKDAQQAFSDMNGLLNTLTGTPPLPKQASSKTAIANAVAKLAVAVTDSQQANNRIGELSTAINNGIEAVKNAQTTASPADPTKSDPNAKTPASDPVSKAVADIQTAAKAAFDAAQLTEKNLGFAKTAVDDAQKTVKAGSETFSQDVAFSDAAFAVASANELADSTGTVLANAGKLVGGAAASPSK
jgi:hypothetical protein